MNKPITLPDTLRKLLPPSLTSVASGVDLRKGEKLFRQRQRPRYMFFVVQGEVVLERIGEQGAPLALQRVRQGFVAEASLQSGSYHCDAVVTAPGRAVALPIEPLKTALTTDSAFALRWIAMLNAEVRRLRAQCERMSLKGVGERLLHMIETEGVGGRLHIESGLKSLAAELAVSHEALYRAVAVLEKDDTVYREQGFIAVARGQNTVTAAE
ncbi:Crp/Fnr family transcriptional regulator [Hydrogenophaga sp. BPS33]|uniref:Crp/Fnr family transcriptional regulator n=1 Tax=Hydrogenophaga sp. BPS33 TaxID=2651974 RepID=UPI00131F6091|nr:Crp/Fnr family transcriptional regulator [Hydrogenophaga sp. BPS33]QHE85318.1 Crp/Fnr family transcriptional regulator [Hydrogenophaga sp. BPS33]